MSTPNWNVNGSKSGQKYDCSDVSRYYWALGVYGPFLGPNCPRSFSSTSRVTISLSLFLILILSLIVFFLYYFFLFFSTSSSSSYSAPSSSSCTSSSSSSSSSSCSSWAHLYPWELSRALRQGRLPSAYKCISCPWTSCTTWVMTMIWWWLRWWWWWWWWRRW